MAKKTDEELKLERRKKAQERAEMNLERVKIEINRRFPKGAVITPQKRNSISKILAIVRNMDNEDSTHLIQSMSANMNKALVLINNICTKRRNASDKALNTKREVEDPLANFKEGMREKAFAEFDVQVRDSILKAYNKLNESLEKISKVNNIDPMALSGAKGEKKKSEEKPKTENNAQAEGQKENTQTK